MSIERMSVKNTQLFLLMAGAALIASTCDAQSVQLPTVRSFGYSGSVLVPDGGTTSLGGVSRSASSISRRPIGHAVGRASSQSGLSVSAEVIDLAEMDHQIRGVGRSDARRSAVADKGQHLRQTELGKRMVRSARTLYRNGYQSEAFREYERSIKILEGRLQRLAVKEFRHVFGIAADQALLPFRL